MRVGIKNQQIQISKPDAPVISKVHQSEKQTEETPFSRLGNNWEEGDWEEIRPNHFPPHSLAHEYQNVKTQGWPTTGGVAVDFFFYIRLNLTIGGQTFYCSSD